ncbi:MAG TPA: MFS transporter [Steroidobacteraceae bacterium]|nr:MFS transporter [Steroidobacteraceae bacterium]
MHNETSTDRRGLGRGYKITLLAALYVAQGLPYGFFTQALPVLLRDAGYSLKAISATSLLFLPWALKFLWAPFVDHRGTRKAWLLPLQFAAVGAAAWLAFLEPGEGLVLLLAAAFLFNTIAACQDIATDGLAVRVLDPRERGLANGLQVGAYRFGMILGGGFLLWVFARSDWTTMFGCMAALLALTVLPVLPLREPPRGDSGPAPGFAVLARGWIVRLRVPGMLGFVVLVCFYKFGDSMAASLVGPFMRDQGLSKEMIALMKGTVGSLTSLAGAACGGWLAFQAGRRVTLLACGLLQTSSLLLYVAAAAGAGGIGLLWAATVAEHLLGSMATVALFTLMMDASDPEHAGTDYTLLACAVVVAMGLASFAGATVADAAGYATGFGAGAVLSLLGCLALVHALDARRGPARLRAVWV